MNIQSWAGFSNSVGRVNTNKFISHPECSALCVNTPEGQVLNVWKPVYAVKDTITSKKVYLNDGF